MSLLKKSLIAPSLAILLATNLYSANYTVDTTNATKAIEKISELSNIPFIVDTNILNGKNTNKIQNVQNLDEALKLMFEGTGLEAVVKNNTIVIKKIEGKGTVLEPISVNESYKNGTAENGYLSEDITGVGLWGKRSLQDTPYSMTVIPKDLIENTQAKDMDQIFKIIPTAQGTGSSIIGDGDTRDVYIRGFSSQNPIIDGIPYATERASIPMMQDIEKVEVINGATGFLYGGGRVGGAVNYITKKPTTEDLRNVIIGSYGDESYFSHIDLSGQFDKNHTFGYRVNALYQNGELPSTIKKEQKGISLVFDWKPTDNFYTDLKYSHKQANSNRNNTEFYGLTDRTIFKPGTKYTPDWVDDELKSNKIDNNMKWNINDKMTLRSGAMYEEIDSRYGTNYIFDEGNATTFRQMMFRSNWQKAKNYGAYAYLDNQFDTANINHNLTLGYSINNFKSYTVPGWIYQEISGVSIAELKNTPWIGSNSFGGSKLISRQTEYKNTLIGDDIVFNDQWSALVGFNYATVIQTSYDNGIQDSKYDKSELTPTLSLMYKPFEDLTTYVTYIESLETGEIVADTYSNAGEILDPLVSKQYEIGAKYSVNESILLTSALFRIEKANQYSNNETPMPKYVQDGEQVHQGIELTFTGKVTDDLTLFGGGTLMDLSIEKSNDKSLEGKKPTNAATKMAKLYAEYNIPQINGLTVTGGAYYTGEKYGDDLNTDKIPSYTLYDTGLRYKTKLDKYPTTFLLNVANLTGKDYWASSSYLGDPRSVAFSMKMEF
ncbi:TonB-dependent siderophore receptor [Aliarcobacter butzleri]|uniref:TonB-dependent siderophore receptor n=1 Tax=Aliarcobacter butzleri TaxID=28197 RepID=UPI003B20E279